MSRPDAAERPDWASGPEWEGWKRFSFYSPDETLLRRAPELVSLQIERDGRMHIIRHGDSVTLLCNSPADALEVANLIAEKLGGWGE